MKIYLSVSCLLSFCCGFCPISCGDVIVRIPPFNQSEASADFTQLLLLGNLIVVTCLIVTLWNKADSGVSTMLTMVKNFFLPPTKEQMEILRKNHQEEGSRRHAGGISKRTTDHHVANIDSIVTAPDIRRTELGGFPGTMSNHNRESVIFTPLVKRIKPTR